jgi:hypothetical protein
MVAYGRWMRNGRKTKLRWYLQVSYNAPVDIFPQKIGKEKTLEYDPENALHGKQW